MSNLMNDLMSMFDEPKPQPKPTTQPARDAAENPPQSPVRERNTDKGRPEPGKVYRLTGDQSIASGNTWAESEVSPDETKPTQPEPTQHRCTMCDERCSTTTPDTRIGGERACQGCRARIDVAQRSLKLSPELDHRLGAAYQAFRMHLDERSAATLQTVMRDVLQSVSEPTDALPLPDHEPMAITFSRLRNGGWGVRGPAHVLQPGAQVTVTKRDGSKQKKIISAVLWSDGSMAIASIRRGR